MYSGPAQWWPHTTPTAFHTSPSHHKNISTQSQNQEEQVRRSQEVAQPQTQGCHSVDLSTTATRPRLISNDSTATRINYILCRCSGIIIRYVNDGVISRMICWYLYSYKNSAIKGSRHNAPSTVGQHLTNLHMYNKWLRPQTYERYGGRTMIRWGRKGKRFLRTNVQIRLVLIWMEQLTRMCESIFYLVPLPLLW